MIRSALRMPCYCERERKMGKSHRKRWKILRLIYIVFFIVIKKIAKNWQEFSHRLNNLNIYDKIRTNS